jgi:hypothetical protein
MLAIERNKPSAMGKKSQNKELRVYAKTLLAG